MLDVSQSASDASDPSVSDSYSRRPIEWPLEFPPGHPIEYQMRYSAKGHIFEGLGACAPVGAGADESASLRLIKTGRLPICKRPAPYFKQVIHIEWLIRT